jgi:hypothetical protein
MASLTEIMNFALFIALILLSQQFKISERKRLHRFLLKYSFFRPFDSAARGPSLRH